MSDVGHQVTDILLPEASIAVFSKDTKTLDAAKSLKADWRFARVNVDIVDGDVDSAVEAFQERGSSDLVIIQTDDINDSFTERLGDLSSYCDEDTVAIIIGPVNDVYLYRKLIEMGVSDYLVRPVESEILTDVISKALIKRLGVSDSRLIAFVGSKGGVGTSCIAQLCSLKVSEKLEKKALLMDGAGGWSSLSVGMGFDPVTTLKEVSRAVEAGSSDALDRMFFSVGEHLNILASGADSMLDSTVSSANYEAIVDNLMVKSPIVLVDLSGAESSLKKAILSIANYTVVVTTPTVTSLRFCRSLLKEIADIRGGELKDTSLLVNMSGISKANEVSDVDIAEALEFKPCANIPNLPALFLKHESEMKQMLSDKGVGAVATALAPILSKIIISDCQEKADIDNKNSGVLGGFLSKFTSK